MIDTEYIITERKIFGWILQGKITKQDADPVRSRSLSEHDKQEHADFIASRIRCDKTDCMDYHKELCSPWKCTYYLRKHDNKIRLDELEKILKPFEEYTASLQDIESSYIKYILNKIIQALRQHKEDIV